MTKEKFKICGVCEKKREKVTSLKTYNGTFVDCCPPCKLEMKETRSLMDASLIQQKQPYELFK